MEPHHAAPPPPTLPLSCCRVTLTLGPPAHQLVSLPNQPTASFNPNAAAAAAAQVLRNEKKRLEGERSKCYVTNLCPHYHIARLKNYMSVKEKKYLHL
jgi:hypothetical protein